MSEPRRAFLPVTALEWWIIAVAVVLLMASCGCTTPRTTDLTDPAATPRNVTDLTH